MKVNFRKGGALFIVLVLTGAVLIVMGGVFGYISYSARFAAEAVGRDICRLAAQSEIELAKEAIFNRFQGTVGAKSNVITAEILNSNKAKKAPSSFDWFEAYSGNTAKKTIGTGTTAITFDDSVTVNGCTVRTRVGRIDHPANAQYADVMLVAEAVRTNPGGTKSSSIIMETFRFAQGRSMVFNYAYFVNNYGWFEGNGAVANGDVRANGNMYLSSNCLINGQVYASKNPALGVNGTVTNTGKADTEQNYKHNSYGTADRARPLSVKSGDGGYVGPEKKGNNANSFVQDRVHQNLESSIEMPYIGDLTTENSDYLTWARALHAADSSQSVLKYKDQNGQNKTISVIYNGVGPSGLEKVSVSGSNSNGQGNKVQAPDYNSVVLTGTYDNPIQINGPVIIPSDVIISGYVTGQGTIYSGRNIHIVGSVIYKNPPKWTGRSINRQDVVQKDMLGLMAKGNIVLGDYTQSDWLSSINTYLTKEPYVQKYQCDTSDAAIGYPATFGGSYVAEERISSSDFDKCASIGLTSFIPGGYESKNGTITFGKLVEKEVTKNGQKNTEQQVAYGRKYYESVCGDALIKSLCGNSGSNSGSGSYWGGFWGGNGNKGNGKTAGISQIDAVLYNNHGVFGNVGTCSFNGSMVCRNEGINYSGNLYFNWDVRLYSGCAETVDNDSVGLARGCDGRPQSLGWMELPQGIVKFD